MSFQITFQTFFSKFLLAYLANFADAFPFALPFNCPVQDSFWIYVQFWHWIIPFKFSFNVPFALLGSRRRSLFVEFCCVLPFNVFLPSMGVGLVHHLQTTILTSSGHVADRFSKVFVHWGRGAVSCTRQAAGIDGCLKCGEPMCTPREKQRWLEIVCCYLNKA